MTQAFAADLQELFDNVSNLDPRVMVGISDGTISASAAVADEEMNRLVLQLASVAEKHGIRFPRVGYSPRSQLRISLVYGQKQHCLI